jgi:hypothetical protein
MYWHSFGFAMARCWDWIGGLTAYQLHFPQFSQISPLVILDFSKIHGGYDEIQISRQKNT